MTNSYLLGGLVSMNGLGLSIYIWTCQKIPSDDSSIVFLQVLAALGIAVPWFRKKNWGIETGHDGLNGSFYGIFFGT